MWHVIVMIISIVTTVLAAWVYGKRWPHRDEYDKVN